MKSLHFKTEVHLRNGHFVFVFLAWSEQLRSLSLCRNIDLVVFFK